MKTKILLKVLLGLLVTITSMYSSCVQQKVNSVINETDQKLWADSVKMEQYFQWTQKVEYINAFNYDHSALSSADKNRDSLMLLSFIIANYDSIKHYEDFYFQPSELVKSVYAIDLNGDDLLDIIYNGPTGGEQYITQIFLNKSDHYEKVFSGYQDIIKADFSNKRLNSFTLINPGCCADPQVVEYYYSVTFADHQPTFKLDKTIGYLSQTEKPIKQLSPPKKLSVLTDNAKLRSDCYLLDNIEHPIYGDHGNAIASYKLGSTGMALGTKKYKKVEWVYVIMSAENKIDSCDFPTFKEQATAIKGWMLKSDIKLY